MILVDGAEHGEPFRADHSELLIFVLYQFVVSIEQFLEVQELLVYLEDMYWGIVISKELLRSDSVSKEDLEHCALGLLQLVERYQCRIR